MLRVSKLTDYATVALSYMASHDASRLFTAAELSSETGVAQPTVSKILKLLTKASVLQSIQGAKGGYSLVSSPDKTTVASIISAIEGPVSITECSSETGHCEQESNCSIRWNWGRINHAIQTALDSVTLADMVVPKSTSISKVTLSSLYDSENRLIRSK
jgi:FeS assembly SUF system regulator